MSSESAPDGLSSQDDYVAEAHPEESAKGTKERAAGWEWLVIAAICIFCISYWAAHHHKFYLPHPDYHSFEGTAREIWSGQMPSNYKRMPLYPAIFGALAQVLPAENPYLESALILNMVFSAGVLALLFLFLRGLIGKAAIVPVGFMAMGMLFLDQALLPILEPFMVCMILLTIWLFARGSRWQYVAAFFAALTRYEASALIAILFLLNSFHLRSQLFGGLNRENLSAIFKLEWGDGKRVLKNLLFAALASSGFLVWMALSFTQSEYGNPHIELMQDMGWPTDVEFAFRSVAEPFFVWADKAREGGYMAVFFALFIAMPTIFGVFVSLKKFGRVSLAILMFAALYVLAQVIYGIGHLRYAYPVLWVPPLYFAVGWAAILAWCDRKIFGDKLEGKALLVVSIIVVVISCAALWSAFDKVNESDGTALRPLYVSSGESGGGLIPTPDKADISANYVYPIFWIVITGSIFAFGFLLGREKGGRALIVGFLLASMLGYYGATGIRRHADISWRRYYRYYESFIVGRFMENLLQPGQRVAVQSTGSIEMTTDIPEEDVFRFGHLDAETLEELPDSLERNNIHYVVYTWRTIYEKEERPESWLVQEARKYPLMREFKNAVDNGEIGEFDLVAVLDWPDRQIGEAPRIYRFKRMFDR